MKMGRLLRAEYTDAIEGDVMGPELEVNFEILDGGLIDRLTLYFDAGFSLEDFYVDYSSTSSFLTHRFTKESHEEAKAAVAEVLPSYKLDEFLQMFPLGFYFNDGSDGRPDGYFSIYEVCE